ncbi:MAG: aminotransferase class IV [Patescibacteria group bacterium]|nr:aminotransferase class IV [Patescibacteria group bacterium]
MVLLAVRLVEGDVGGIHVWDALAARREEANNRVMVHPQAFLNGAFIPASAMMISPTDAGFVLGVTVAEQLRTFRGELFRLEDHLCRLYHSLEVVGTHVGTGQDDVAAAARKLVAHNHGLLGPEEELGLSIFVTPGCYATFAPNVQAAPTLGMHTYRLPFALWAERYRTGQALVTASVRQVPAACWPTDLKCRSRMHYYLADRDAAARQPGARALLLDLEGRVTEASTANVLVYRSGEGLISPPLNRILHGISLDVAFRLAGELGIRTVFRALWPGEVAEADEVLLSSTSPCLLPVTQLDGHPIGAGGPGKVFQSLIKAWGELVGVDIVGQAIRGLTPHHP